MTRTPGTLKSAAELLLIVVAVLVIAVSLTGGLPGGGSLFSQQTATPQPGGGSGSPHAKNVIVLIGDGMGYA
jgi:alkaline phosphatase